MFEFTTQTILNSVVPTTVQAFRNGTVPVGANFIKAGQDDNAPVVRIGNCRFDKEVILDVQKKIHSEELLTEITFDMADVVGTPGNYRIMLYLGLNMSSQDAFYANDFVYKGKPLFIEFPVKEGDTAAGVASRVLAIAKKYMLFMLDNAPMLKVSAKNGKVTFKGVTGYQNIRSAALQKFNPQASTFDCCNYRGDYEDIKVGVPLNWTMDENGVITVGAMTLGEDGQLRGLEENEIGITPGVEAFCDYNWIIHNLRIPTGANTDFWSVNKNEMPVPGGKYNQYIIRMCKKRDGIAGEVVGQRALSVTTHVFYVLDAGTNTQPFEDFIATLESEKQLHRADDVFADPFNPPYESESTQTPNPGEQGAG